MSDKYEELRELVECPRTQKIWGDTVVLLYERELDRMADLLGTGGAK